MDFSYEIIKQRIEEIKNAETPEDAGALILAFENDLSKIEDDKNILEARVKELETDVVTRDERIKNLLKRNDELRYSLSEQYKKEEKKDEELDRDRYEIDGLSGLDEVL